VVLRRQNSSSKVVPGSVIIDSIICFCIVGISSTNVRVVLASSLNLSQESCISTSLTGCSRSNLVWICFRSAVLCRSLSLTISQPSLRYARCFATLSLKRRFHFSCYTISQQRQGCRFTNTREPFFPLLAWSGAGGSLKGARTGQVRTHSGSIGCGWSVPRVLERESSPWWWWYQDRKGSIKV
jgi:hypothetical protein